MPKKVCICGGIKDENGCRRCGKKRRPENRLPAHKRGYDKQWEKFSKEYRQENPLCIDCLNQGRTTPSRDVHHIRKLIDYPHLKYDEDNLMALCKDCHDIRTRRGE